VLNKYLYFNYFHTDQKGVDRPDVAWLMLRNGNWQTYFMWLFVFLFTDMTVFLCLFITVYFSIVLTVMSQSTPVTSCSITDTTPSRAVCSRKFTTPRSAVPKGSERWFFIICNLFIFTHLQVAKASEKWGPEKIGSDMALGCCGGGCNVGHRIAVHEIHLNWCELCMLGLTFYWIIHR